MIELNEQQRQAVAQSQTPLTVIDAQTNTAYVLIRKDDYERLVSDLYDDSPWTDEEMDLLHEEAARMADNFGKQR